jgi:hypothetical protein
MVFTTIAKCFSIWNSTRSMKPLADGGVYTLEKMVAQFADGIARCLGQ